jgi:hypothetical protein
MTGHISDQRENILTLIDHFYRKIEFQSIEESSMK